MMKAIPYILLLPLALIVLFTQCEKEPDHVSITDDAFLNALIEEGVDTNGDGIISLAEAEAVISLDVYRENISDLTGIELFVNLEALFCSRNQLTSLNVSNNTALTRLWCGWNQLTSLDVSNNTALTDLFCGNNQLTSLDISNNMQLHFLKLEEMPSLYEVCVWELPFPTEEIWVFDTTGSPNVYFTTECSK
jgi:Leucine-rich repeat (LRR) protein